VIRRVSLVVFRRPARASPSTFLFLPIQMSKSSILRCERQADEFSSQLSAGWLTLHSERVPSRPNRSSGRRPVARLYAGADLSVNSRVKVFSSAVKKSCFAAAKSLNLESKRGISRFPAPISGTFTAAAGRRRSGGGFSLAAAIFEWSSRHAPRNVASEIPAAHGSPSPSVRSQRVPETHVGFRPASRDRKS